MNAPSQSGRFLVVDFETNGFVKSGMKRSEMPLPYENCPTQISVDLVEQGEAKHLFDCYIRGATRFTPYVREKVQVTLEQAASGESFKDVVARIAEHLDEDTTIVAHNADYDIVRVLQTTAEREGLATRSSAGFCKPRGTAP